MAQVKISFEGSGSVTNDGRTAYVGGSLVRILDGFTVEVLPDPFAVGTMIHKTTDNTVRVKTVSGWVHDSDPVWGNAATGRDDAYYRRVLASKPDKYVVVTTDPRGFPDGTLIFHEGGQSLRHKVDGVWYWVNHPEFDNDATGKGDAYYKKFLAPGKFAVVATSRA